MNQPSVASFFNNLPQKQCSKCGSYLQEQADCYWNECFECMDLHIVPVVLAPRHSSVLSLKK